MAKKVTNAEITAAATELAKANADARDADARAKAAKDILTVALEQRGSLTNLGIVLAVTDTYSIPLEYVEEAFPNGLRNKNVSLTKADVKQASKPELIVTGTKKSWKVDAVKK
ncbi:MAG: hypothetical protein ACK5XN_15730 [Bacteroidota bacterium]|jgi:hypothetical protein